MSHVDTPLLLSSLPLPFRHRTVVAAAADYFFDRRWKADAWSFFLAAIPIERTKVNRRSAELAAELLEEGWNLVIFPEGGRSPDGWAQTFRGGAAYLAARTGCPVVPIHIDGTRHILPKGTNAVRRTRTTITFGTPLSPTEDEDARRFGSRIEAAVATMANEVTTDWWSARKQAAAGVTPALQGPNVAPWRRTWRLPEPPPPRDSGAEDGADRTACGPGAAKRRRPRRGSAVPPGALGGPPTDRRPTPAVRREGPTPRHRREVPGRRPRHPQGPPEEEVGQDGVAGQNRAVEIRAEHPTTPGTFAPCAVPVAHAPHHLADRRRTRAQCGDRAVVLETGEHRQRLSGGKPGRFGARARHHFADCAPRSPSRWSGRGARGRRAGFRRCRERSGPAVGIRRTPPAPRLRVGRPDPPLRRPGAPRPPEPRDRPLPHRCSRCRRSAAAAPRWPG